MPCRLPIRRSIWGNPMKGPFKAVSLDWEAAAAAALELARIAGILPAFLVDPVDAGEAVAVAVSDLAAYSQRGRAEDRHPRASACLGLRGCRNRRLFAPLPDLREHVALVIGKQSGDRQPLVRLHSECLTGDILGSLKCDCGPQLDAALYAMAHEASDSGGWGVLLYMRQEGRGIGLVNKLRAYRLQDQGFDTVEANQRLGLPDEARDFPVAARMLELLGAGQIRLLTNNPAKVAALEAAGITVSERVPHQLPENPPQRPLSGDQAGSLRAFADLRAVSKTRQVVNRHEGHVRFSHSQPKKRTFGYRPLSGQ